MSRVARLLSLLTAACGMAGCARVQARMPEPVPLAMPAPDRPLLIPVSIEPDPEPEPPVADATPPAPESPPTPTPRPPRTAPAASSPDPPSEEAAAPPVLSTTTQDPSVLERRARERLDNAGRSLAQLNYAELGRDARAQYDEVRRFIKLAQEKIQTRSYVYAADLAERAELLARLLVTR